MTHELLLCLQDLRENLPDIFTSLALFLSSPIVYLLIPMAFAAVLYLCVDKRKGEWMMLNISVGAFIGHFLKDIICNPRPWLTDDRLHPVNEALKDANGYSTPSSHSIESTTGFGSLIPVFRRRWVSLVLIAVILSVMMSRLFLGVHTLLDVTFGAALAIAIMAINWFLVNKSYSDEHSYVAVSVLLVLVFIASSLAWYLISDSTVSLMRYGGLMLGTIAGRYLEHSLLGYEIGKVTITKNVLRCAVGLIVTAACFIIPFLTLGSNIGSFTGGLLATIGLFFICPAVLGALRLND